MADMYDPFEKNARRRRRKAVMITLLFNLALAAALVGGGQIEWRSWVPDALARYLPAEEQPATEPAVTLTDEAAARP